ncbi:MAG: hypothetical protein HQL39_05960, partial [Alphaproteobacteria bacterium]|nr:hypothetical protein [Alphaproteobacteria bacterium]
MSPEQGIPTEIRPEILGMVSRTKPTAFVNREDELAEMRAATEDLFNDRMRLGIQAYYGVGGIGKTRLLDEYIRRWCWNEWEPRYLISVSLQAQNFLAPLLEIRKRFPFSADEFDATLSVYWKAIGESHRLESFFGGIRPSFVSRLLTASLGVPVEIFEESYRRLTAFGTTYKRRPKLRLLESAYGPDVNLADVAELENLLPTFLGEAFRVAHDSNLGRFVFILDRYDNQPLSARAGRSDWLRSMIAASGSGLFLIGSREKITWSIGSVSVENRRINPLGRDHANAMLESRGIRA